VSPSYFLPLNSLTHSNRIVTGSPSRTRARTHAPDPPPTRGQSRWLPPLALALCAALAAAGCKPQGQSPPPSLPPPPVTVAKPLQVETVEWDEYTGRTEAVQSVEVRPRVSGYIDRVAFKDGALVNPGDLLFVIDPRPYQAEVDQGAANLQNAEAQRRLQLANFTRAEKLFQTRVTSKEEYDTSLARKDQSEAQYHQAQAQLSAARLNLGFTQVRAPIRGRIARQLVTPGNLVQADSTVLTTLVSVDPIYAYFTVDERTLQKYVDQVKGGGLADARTSPVAVYLQGEGERGFPHEGVIDFINNAYNASTGSLQVRARFPNADGWLMPGAFVRVRVAGTPKHQAMLISDRAVGTDQGQKFVLLVDQNRTVQARPVELGPLVEGLRVVRRGLSPDDQVIINGLLNARPGAPVTPQPGDMAQWLAGQAPPGVSLSEGAPRPASGLAAVAANGHDATH
jgi:membrane fusion protein, multidrug efflux system